MKRFFGLFITAVMMIAPNVHGDILMTGTTFSESFDSMPTTTSAAFFSPTIGTQTAITGTGFVGTKLGGSGATGASLFADTGASSSGGLYSYGAASVAERALGSLASGTNIMGFGVKITNNSGLDFGDLTISFTQENWRSSTANQNVIAASYSTTASDSDFLSSTTGFTAVTDLDLVGPTPVAANAALDGNDPLNQVARTFTFTGLNLANGSSIYLRWQDINDGGNDAGLAIDNFSISATTTAIPEPTSMAVLGCALAGGYVARRRSKKVVA